MLVVTERGTDGGRWNRSWPPDEVLHERACLDRIQEAWRTTQPLVEWLGRQVGVAAI
ncbi:MAG TPA: hypothetical protein VF788_13920 [Pseudonocardiaceae bacterium]